MNCLGAGLLCGRDYLFDNQIAFIGRCWTNVYRLMYNSHMKRGSIVVRIDFNGRDAQFTTAASYANRNLASIGNQYAFEHRRKESLNEKGKSEHLTFASFRNQNPKSVFSGVAEPLSSSSALRL